MSAVFFLKSRLIFNIFYCFCMIVNKFQETLRIYNWVILTTKNAKFSGLYLYMNTNIKEDFQICVSVPLIKLQAQLQQACNFIKKETRAQMFSCEFCKISKNTFSTECLQTTDSEASTIKVTYTFKVFRVRSCLMRNDCSQSDQADLCLR